jgi:hypothetical protein
VTFTDGTQYLGKKLCKTTEKKQALKNGKPRDNHIKFTYRNKNGKRIPYEILHKELQWRSYIGSFDKTEWESNEVKTREILSYHATKKGMSYAENSLLFSRKVLESDAYRNSNIGGAFFPSNIEEVTQ